MWINWTFVNKISQNEKHEGQENQSKRFCKKGFLPAFKIILL